MTVHHIFLILVMSLYLTGASAADVDVTELAPGHHQYTVHIQQDLTQLAVKACFASPLPEKLVSYDDLAADVISAITLSSGQVQKRLRPGKHSIVLQAIQPGDCVSYKVAINSKVTHHRFNRRQSTHQQMLLNIHRWLWFPGPLETDAYSLDITFKLPQGMSVSAPWPRIVQGEDYVTYRYDYNQRPPDTDGRIAIGHFKTVTRILGNAQINIAILNGQPAVDSASVLYWIDKNLGALMLAYGEFPVPDLQLLIVPVGRDREAVPWGQAMRGGGDGVHLYIDQTRPLQEFLDDWVLSHELSHLLHPWIFNRDAWLPEGLASYYQNVLRARADMLSPHMAWKKLHQGFQRGIRDTSPRRSLAQVSETMMRDRSFMRVYWSGAAIGLLADYRLRKQSHGQLSLDSALAEFHHCCLPSRHRWSSWEVMQKLDAITHTHVFSELYHQHIPSSDFPDLSHVYSELGLVGERDEIKLDDAAPSADIRRSIMSSAR